MTLLNSTQFLPPAGKDHRNKKAPLTSLAPPLARDGTNAGPVGPSRAERR
jgi:hypothetical protein